MDTKKLRQKILDLAIHGKLVPQDPNDEPASVLLERIRAEKERLIKEGKIKRSKKSASDMPHYENIDFEVPSSWVITTLSDVFFMHAGKSISATNISTELNEENRYLCVGGNGKRGYVSSYNTVGAHPIIGRQGALCGNVNYTDGQVYATEHAVVVDTFCETEAWWAYYFLKQLNLNQYATATAQPGLSVNTIGDVQIPLPPYKEQVRIVAAIEQWYSLIDALETAKEDLQTSIEYTKSKILDLAIHGKLVPQDPNDEPAIELLKRINSKFVPCDNAHDTNQLPDSWCWSTLGDVCSFISGYSYSSSEYKKAGIPLVRISDINDGIISLDNCAYIQPQGERNVYLQKGDILIAMSGATTGKMGIYMNEESAILNQRVGVVRVTDSKIISEKYRDYFLYRKSSDILKLAYGGAQPNISGKMICSLLLPLPPYSEQLRIVAKIEELFAVLDEIQKSIEA